MVPSASSAPVTRPPAPVRRSSAVAFADLDAAAAVQGAEVVGGGGGGDAGEDARRRFDQRDLEALLAQHRRRLEADVAAADDQRPRARAR